MSQPTICPDAHCDLLIFLRLLKTLQNLIASFNKNKIVSSRVNSFLTARKINPYNFHYDIISVNIVMNEFNFKKEQSSETNFLKNIMASISYTLREMNDLDNVYMIIKEKFQTGENSEWGLSSGGSLLNYCTSVTKITNYLNSLV